MNNKDDKTISKVKITPPQADFWNDLPDSIKKSIVEAKVQLDKGEGISHDLVMANVIAQFLSCKGK